MNLRLIVIVIWKIVNSELLDKLLKKEQVTRGLDEIVTLHRLDSCNVKVLKNQA